MDNIIYTLKNSKGGSLLLADNGDIFIEGSYYIIRDKHLSLGNRDVRIPKGDILRVGRRQYAASAILIRACAMFFLSGVVYGLIGKIQSGTGKITDVTDKVSDAADHISDFYESSIISSTGEAASNVSDFFSNISLVILIAAILLFVLSAFSLVKYLLSHKRLLEVNTAYGFFCISLNGVNKPELDSFISAFYNIGTQQSSPPPPVPEAPSDVWYCSKCGAKNEDNFCSRCGNKRM